jgi:hypothetical protein
MARCWARLIDVGVAHILLEMTVGIFCLELGMEIPYSKYPIPAYVGTFFLWVLFLISYEAVMLSTTKTTVGKWLLGVFVIRNDGSRLSVGKAFARANRVIKSGLYYLIAYPVLTFFALWNVYTYALRHDKLPWDSDSGIQVHNKTIGLARHIFGAILAMTCVVSYFVIRKILAKENFLRDFIGN